MNLELENKKFHTLLVENSITYRRTLNEALCDYFPFIQVDEAENGEIALHKINTLTPDIIFMDIRLPGDNGIKLTRAIKNKFHDIVIVILSSYDIPEYRQAAFRNGADCFIAKESLSCMDDILARVEGTISSKMPLPVSV